MKLPKIIQVSIHSYDLLGLDEIGNLYKAKIGYEGSVVTYKWVLIIDNEDSRELKVDASVKTNAGIPVHGDFLTGRN
jgi:hypothetical protein